VHDGGVGTDDEVEVHHDGGRIDKGAASSVDVIAKINKWQLVAGIGLCIWLSAFLQADEPYARQLS